MDPDRDLLRITMEFHFTTGLFLCGTFSFHSLLLKQATDNHQFHPSLVVSLERQSNPSLKLMSLSSRGKFVYSTLLRSPKSSCSAPPRGITLKQKQKKVVFPPTFSSDDENKIIAPDIGLRRRPVSSLPPFTCYQVSYRRRWIDSYHRYAVDGDLHRQIHHIERQSGDASSLFRARLWQPTHRHVFVTYLYKIAYFILPRRKKRF